MRVRAVCLAVAFGFLPVVTSELSAQTGMSSGPRIMVGPFLGVNYTTISGDSVSDASYRTGIAVGGQLQADFYAGWFFRTAVLYSQRGADATIDGTKVTFKESFVEAPLLLGYSFSSAGSTVRPFVMAGAEGGVKVSCDLSGSSGGTSLSFKCDDAAVATDFKSTNFAAVAGAGVMFSVAGGTISLDARYAYGLTDIAENSDAYHRGFTAGIAYMIRLGH